MEKSMEFFHAYVFHWVPQKAIYINGKALLWDARCCGIYSGYAFGIIWHIITAKQCNSLPSHRIVLISLLLCSSMFLDIGLNYLALKNPSNFIRFITGIAFGNFLSIFLYPILINSFSRAPQYHTAFNSIYHYLSHIAICASLSLLIRLDYFAVFAFYQFITLFGFIALAGMLMVSFVKNFPLSDMLPNVDRNHNSQNKTS